MDQLDFWLDPVVELPLPLAAGTLLGIVLLSLWRIHFGIFLLLVTVPLQRFIVIPGVLGNRFTPHEAAFLSLVLSTLVRGGAEFKLTPPWTGPIAIPFLMLLSVGVLSLLDNPFISEGMPELVILGYVYLLMHVVYDLASNPASAFFAFRAWYLTAVAFILLATYGVITQLMGVGTFLMIGPRLLVTFFNPNQTGSFILAGAFLFLAKASHAQTPRLERILNLAFVFCSVIGGYFTASRATVLGGLIGLIVFLGARRVRISAILAVAAMLICGRFAMTVFEERDQQNASLYNTRYSEGVDPDSRSAQTRLENWQTGIDAFTRSPVVGIGLGTLYLQVPPTLGQSYQVHNSYVSFLGETGILGFASLLGIMTILVRACVVGLRMARGTPYEDPMVALIPALAALGVFNIFHYGIRARHLWVTMGLVFAFHRLAARHRATMTQPSITAAVTTVRESPKVA